MCVIFKVLSRVYLTLASYPAIVKTQIGFDIMDKFKQYEELSARKPLIYDNSGLTIP